MKAINSAQIKFLSVSGNESFARVAVTAFLLSQDPTIEELSEIKTAVSEAVTNAMIHGYKNIQGTVYISMYLYKNNKFVVKVRDKGLGISDIKQAMEPLFTTGGEEQAGIGFAVMESFCDKLKVTSTLGKGTCVTLTKFLENKKSHE